MFSTVLIANRGEIALRVARTCRELGLRVVAVHSTEDRDSAVVRLADESVQIGPASARRSYLNIPALIEAARRTGADALHPGYGFLSEDADLAAVCAENGITFVGSPAPVLEVFGDKIAARALMAEAGLPLLPGSAAPLESVAAARAAADAIGYPVILKAAAGGGGNAMAVVREAADLPAAWRRIRADAQALFGDDRVYLERHLGSARHVEVQLLCDAHGNVLPLGTRDCSVQRRRQKLIEEAPAPRLPGGLAERMSEAAVAGARAAGCVGAATFEFLVSPDGSFAYLETNCRIQVEHPVTEMVTGVDIVAEQFRIAAGRELALGPEDVEPRGAAIECRINAEDPDRGFAPAPGLLTEFRLPGGPFVRADTHGFPGYRVPAAYDSLLAKLVVWAPDRDRALRRMAAVLGECRISGPGVRTTAGFLERLIADPRFQDAEHDTSLALAPPPDPRPVH
ncbi:acetyl-CoA carboxylase biotin carboxylase subunit [Actinomadura sp. NAK00032]|uniref:acetyl-CoA carboxylase biotin carboxylase subunit n=1 Tax=Actinomadura sp. NAK00032 TaxID=2742128 RepID=UPI001591FF02|nr:biotin carboxylase N-terminal domain-containing protein [Actinomadura sp. NAK00032]QKW37603.1 acetyl-CoA carboxylase biotin carboxylase subunit [Actinomadura sp. NAK00032]